MLTFRPAYTPHNAFVAPARNRLGMWRLFAGAALILAAYVVPFIIGHGWLSNLYGERAADALFNRMATGDTPGGMFLLLYGFLGLAFGPIVAVRWIEGRRAGTLFGPSATQTIMDFGRAIWPLLGLQVLLLPLALGSDTLRPGLGFIALLGYLPFALPGILIQTGAEELVFRGYFQQGLAARFKNPLIWMGLPALLFGFGHYAPEEFGNNAWLIAIWAMLFSCFAADLTARTGNLGAALAFHVANNISAFLFIGIAGNLDGLALWSIVIDLKDMASTGPLLAMDFLVMFSAWLLTRLTLRV
ncbi:MAG: CPBP family intramembrane glutamic endopeptidase [Albidovulum sp.]